MKKTLLSIALILVVSCVAFVLMKEVAGWTVRKAAWIAFGAGAAMIVFDILLPHLRGREGKGMI
jgi:hypothetical protein